MIKFFNRLYVKYLIWKELRLMVSNNEIEKDFKIIYDKTKCRYVVDVNPIVKPTEIEYIDEVEEIKD